MKVWIYLCGKSEGSSHLAKLTISYRNDTGLSFVCSKGRSSSGVLTEWLTCPRFQSLRKTWNFCGFLLSSERNSIKGKTKQKTLGWGKLSSDLDCVYFFFQGTAPVLEDLEADKSRIGNVGVSGMLSQATETRNDFYEFKNVKMHLFCVLS